MAVDFIGGVSQAATPTPDLAQSALSQQDFLSVMLTQLRFQDPLKPMDNQEFLAQMAQFSSLAQSQQLNDKVDTLLSIEASTQAVGMLGKTVEVASRDGSPASVGQVTSLVLSTEGTTLTVKLGSGELLTGVNPSQVTVVR
jgi:flagellar basal-body rod modification protein FlgD